MQTSERIALVTGAGSGVGRAVTLALLADGYRVVLAGRRKELLHETIQLANVPADRTLGVATDVREPQEVRHLFAETARVFGRLDLLFNNAGVNAAAIPLEDLAYEHLRSVLDTNLMGPFLCTQEAVRMMKSQSPPGGRIINNGSVSAQVPRPHAAPYTATKHAISGLTKSTALDGRPFGIACGQIDIGNASTEMTARMSVGVLQANGERRQEPTMDVNHVARAVLYMANLPLDANVLFMTVMATGMPLVGRG